MQLRELIFSLFLLLLAGCGGGNSTTPAVPASVKLVAAGVTTDNAGNDAVTVTATVTDEEGRLLSGVVEVHVSSTQPSSLIGQQTPSTHVITGMSDANGQ